MSDSDNTQVLLNEFLPDAQALEIREPPYMRRVMLYAVLAIIISAIGWAALSNIDKLVVARGRLVTPLSNLVVQPLESSILKSIEVRIGQIVRKNTVLATLDSTFAHADVNQLSSRSEDLLQKIQRLKSELEGVVDQRKSSNGTRQQLQSNLLAERMAAYTAKVQQYDKSIKRIQASLDSNRQDQAALTTRVTSLKELEAMYLKLETQGQGARSQLLEVQDRRLEINRDRIRAINLEQEILAEIETTEAERTAFVKDWRQKVMEQLSTTLQQHSEVNEQLTKARMRSKLLTLVAPDDAVVLEIGKKSVGSVLEAAETIFVLVPLETKLEAEVEVSPSDVGEIDGGDLVRIKIDAYPFQKYGTLKGRVINISADTFSRRSASGGMDYYYLARISLEGIELEHLPETRLLPGMTVAGEIVTGKRSVISYFLYPVIRVLDESLSEN